MVPRDMISYREFLPLTQQGLQDFCSHYFKFPDYPLDVMMQPEDWAKLFFLMQAAPDNYQFFPSGKWATIQALETKLNEYAHDTVNYVNRKQRNLNDKADVV